MKYLLKKLNFKRGILKIKNINRNFNLTHVITYKSLKNKLGTYIIVFLHYY